MYVSFSPEVSLPSSHTKNQYKEHVFYVPSLDEKSKQIWGEGGQVIHQNVYSGLFCLFFFF